MIVGWDISKKEYIFGEDNHKIPVGCRINPQLYFLDIGDLVISYMPYDKQAVLIEKKHYEYLLTHEFCDRDVPRELLSFKFYGVEKKIMTKRRRLGRILVIFLGDNCNLNCIYCYAEPFRNSKFNESLVVNSTKILLKKYNPENILFFGNGEPTLYFDTIVKIVKIAKRYKKSIKFSITTNGVIEDKSKLRKVASFLKKYGFVIQISMDGFKRYNDFLRPKSFDYIMSFLKTLLPYKKIVVRTTLTKYNIDNIEEFLMWLKGLGITNFRIVTVTGRKDLFPSIKHLREKIPWLMHVADCLKVNLAGNIIPFPSDIGVYPCAFQTGEAISLYNGKIYSCTHTIESFEVGYIDSSGNVVLYEEKIENLKKYNQLYYKECKECPVKCGGGCIYEKLTNFGSLDFPGEFEGYCSLMKEILARYLLLKFDAFMGDEYDLRSP